jgi:uncharacterized protein DUF3293
VSLPGTDTAARIRALLTLYRESHYDVVLARGRVATIRIGEPAPVPLVRWIGDAAIAYYLTACNPRSTSLTPDENEARLATLRADVDGRGLAYLEGTGHIPGEAWREKCLLVRGIGDEDAAQIARRYEQNSIVVARANGPAVLRVYRPDWHALAGETADVEWAAF